MMKQTKGRTSWMCSIVSQDTIILAEIYKNTCLASRTEVFSLIGETAYAL